MRYKMKTNRNPKKRRFAALSFAGVLAALAVCSCSKDAPSGASGGEPQPQGRPIELQGMFGQEKTGAAPDLKAPVDGGPVVGGEETTPELTLWFTRADETASGAYGAYETAQLSAVRPAAEGNTPTALTFADPSPCYQLGGLKTRLTGWFPGGGAEGSEKGYWNGTSVQWTIDGKQDIMTAPAQQGSNAEAMPTLVFSHRTAQLRFYAYAETENIAALWGKITAIRVSGQANVCTYTPSTDGATGAVVFSGSPVVFAAGMNTAAAPSVTTDKAAARQTGESVMIAPQASAYALALEVESDKLGTIPVMLPARVYDPAGAYNIYLRLQAVTISPAVAVSDWGATVEKDVEL